MPFYDAGDAAIYYEIEGIGPPLILLHGYALNSLMWEFQKPILSKTHSLVTIDLRGFGKSSCGKRWSGSVMAEDVMGIIEFLKLSNVTILGFSMGGPVAVRLAIEMPEIITRLILASSSLPSAARPKSKTELKHQELELASLQNGDIAAWTEAIGFHTGPLVDGMFEKNPDIVPLWKRIIERHHRDYLLGMLKCRLETETKVDWRSRLPEIRQRTLIIVGAEDKHFLDAAAHLAATISDSKLVAVDGAGHMVNLERPREFNRAISDFLSQ